MRRQQHGHPGPAIVAVYEDEAGMGFDRAMDDAETESAAAWLGRKEGVEQSVPNLERNAPAVVGYAKRNAAAIERHPCGNLIHRQRRELDSHPTATRRRLHGVQREVEHGAMKQVFITFDDHAVVVGIAYDLDVARTIGVRGRKARGTPRDDGEIHGLDLRHADSREVEELREQS